MNLRDYLQSTGLSQARLAEIITADGGRPVTQGAISQWLDKGVPPARVPQIVRISGGKVTAQELRPDIWRDGDAA